MTGYPENRGGFSDVRIYDRTVRNRAIGAWFRIGVVSIPVRRWINMFRVMKGASMRWIPLLACAVFMVSILPVAALQADTIEVPLGDEVFTVKLPDRDVYADDAAVKAAPES